MAPSEQPSLADLTPPWLRQLFGVVMTASAALLYAAVIGTAIIRTLQEGNPTFSSTMTRAASVLSGLVGAVVATGFSRSGRGITIQIAGPRRELLRSPIHWIKRNFFGLAETLGLPLMPEIILWTDPDPESPTEPEKRSPWYEIDEPLMNKVSLGIAILYFLVYFITGIGAFGLAILRPEVPELISNAAWVWIGSLASSGYAFFALNSDAQIH